MAIPLGQQVTFRNIAPSMHVYALRRGAWQSAVVSKAGLKRAEVVFDDTRNKAARPYVELAFRNVRKGGTDKPALPVPELV